MKHLVVTAAGLAAAMDAKEQGIKIKLTHIGLGSEGYTPTPDQIELKAEFLREEFQRSTITSNQLHVEHSFKDADQAFEAKEIGYYLADGTLFAVDSRGGEIISYKSKGTMLTESFDLVLSGELVDSVTVEIKDDLVIYSNPNLFINGCFSECQREIGKIISGAVTYTADRWAVLSDTDATVNIVDVGSRNHHEVYGDADNTLLVVTQRIIAETSKQLVGKSVTVSGFVKCAHDAFDVIARHASGGKNDFSTSTVIARETVKSSTKDYAYFSRTFNDLPNDVIDGLSIEFVTKSTSQEEVFGLSNMQCEESDFATPFVPDEVSVNLAKCRRYCRKIELYDQGFALGYLSTTAPHGFWTEVVEFAAGMRTFPAFTYQANNPAHVKIADLGGRVRASGITLILSGTVDAPRITGECTSAYSGTPDGFATFYFGFGWMLFEAEI